MVTAPCKSCAHRHATCHTECELYSAWQVIHKKEHEQELEERRNHSAYERSLNRLNAFGRY